MTSADFNFLIWRSLFNIEVQIQLRWPEGEPRTGTQLRKAVIVPSFTSEERVFTEWPSRWCWDTHHLWHGFFMAMGESIPTQTPPGIITRAKGLDHRGWWHQRSGLAFLDSEAGLRVRNGFLAGCSVSALSSFSNTWQDLVEVVVRGVWLRK